MCGVVTAAISAMPSPSRSATPTGFNHRLGVPIGSDCATICRRPSLIPASTSREPRSRSLAIARTSTGDAFVNRTRRGVRSSKTSGAGKSSDDPASGIGSRGHPAVLMGSAERIVPVAFDRIGIRGACDRFGQHLWKDSHHHRTEQQAAVQHGVSLRHGGWATPRSSRAVATMSSTLAPRERSEIGFAKPCSTGPMAWAPARYWVSL